MEHSIDDNKVKYINFCVNAFARQYDMSLLESFNYLERYGGVGMNVMRQNICYL